MKRAKKRVRHSPNQEDLDRFAGSSDEEDENKLMAPPAPVAAILDSHHDNEENDDSAIDDSSLRGDEGKSTDVGNDKIDDSSSVEGEELDAATKMANAMTRILGSQLESNEKTSVIQTPVVLAKTVTPLQKLQQKEKELQKAMKEKRQANRERNLTALHLPLSIATTNKIEAGGHLSVAKELEQERFHRRVATRGVVALFNAITQHQKNATANNQESNTSLKKNESSKLTKHGFLDKIKATANTKGSDRQKATKVIDDSNNSTDENRNCRSSWGALQDDYMLGSKKNWDEESSEEEPEMGSDVLRSDIDEGVEESRKRRHVSRPQ